MICIVDLRRTNAQCEIAKNRIPEMLIPAVQELLAAGRSNKAR